MKQILFSIALFLFCSPQFGQDFTWVQGTNQGGLAGSYGTMGVPSTTNSPGGRHGCATWTDAAGNLWLFGGEGYDAANNFGELGDLWKYNRLTNEWTWVRGSNTIGSTGNCGTLGVPSASNDPSSREFALSWTDNTGKLWLFGGEQGVPLKLNDLWRYDPNTNMWTWMKGSTTTAAFATYGSLNVPAAANTPGARSGSATWKDAAGDLWIALGRGYVGSGFMGQLDDVWKYSVNSNQWTWMGGSNQVNQTPVYGNMGVPSTTNTPGGREFPGYWKDHNDKLYIFGGRGQSYMSDLWKYDPVTLTWVWLKGPNTTMVAGIYGTLGNSAPTNEPGARWTPASWIDKYGYLWLFGGTAKTNTSTAFPSAFNQANDLWRYNPCNNQWTWMKGADLTQQPGTYGTMGSAAPQNMPGARMFNNWWKDPAGDLWLFGGEGFDAAGSVVDHMNDLWKFTPFEAADSINASPSKQICTGTSATLNASSSQTGTVQWFASATSTNAVASGTSYATGTLLALNSPSVYSYFAQTACILRPRATVDVTVNPLPTVNITGPGTVCAQTPAVYICTSGSSFYVWNNGIAGPNSTFTFFGNSGTVAVNATSSVGCTSNASLAVTVNPLPTLSVTATPTLICRDYPRTATLIASGANTYSWNGVGGNYTYTLIPTVLPTQTVSIIVVLGQDANGCLATTSVTIARPICGSVKEDYLLSKTISIFPNPSSASFCIDMSALEGWKKITIFGASGQEIMATETNEERYIISEELPSGLYFVQVSTAKGNSQGRFIRQ